MQAEASAAKAGSTGQADVEEGFDAIAGTGRSALVELRRLLGVLREDGPSSTAPQPGLDRLPALIEQVRSAGLPVELRTEGTPGPLADGIDLSAYRIVQEALTNVVKHAGGAPAIVTVRHRPDHVEVEVVDEGNAVAAPAAETGHGLVGIRERVAMCGGELRTGPRPDGGFEVSARLPVGG